jgi:hypothetical protein
MAPAVVALIAAAVSVSRARAARVFLVDTAGALTAYLLGSVWSRCSALPLVFTDLHPIRFRSVR